MSVHFAARPLICLLCLLGLTALPSWAQTEPRVYLNLEPAEVVGGESTQARLGLSRPAPEEGLRVYLDSGLEVDVPLRVTVPAGAEEITFTVETEPVSRPTTVRIEASTENSVQHQHVSLLPESPERTERHRPRDRFHRIYRPYYPGYYYYPHPWFRPWVRPTPRPGDHRLTPIERARSKAQRGPSKAGVRQHHQGD